MIDTPTDIIDRIQKAGIIGAGGGGFPTHIKFSSRVDTVIANGIECEPLLKSDKAVLMERTYSVIEGVQLALKATGASRGFIAVKGVYQDVVDAVKKELPKDGSIKLHLLEDYYPAGDEFLTVYDVTGRVIPSGGIPLDVGVLVHNVLTLSQVAEAVNGKPVTERPITVTGAVRNPQVLTAPIGTLYEDLIQAAGGTLHDSDVLMDGGPMMGDIVQNPGMGISKTTSGIIALPGDHFIIRLKSITISQMVKKSKAACCQCIRCSDLCPRNLIGHPLFPHKTMRTIDYNQSYPTEHITSAFLCSQCGLCELVACDSMQLSPRKVYAEYKRLLSSKGIKNPLKGTSSHVLSSLEYRKVPISLIIKKIGLSEYVKNTPSMGSFSPHRVRIPITRHIGEPAISQVKPGQKIKSGNIIAVTPPGKTGAVYHASISGEVTDITNSYIEIMQ
jgi:Na+-translocating ferredoxin:NAD+ oxidoreductase RnfC subunit